MSQSITERYFPALKQRNFRIFWTGQCISLVGTWMQNVGQDWLVLEITNSPLKLGLVNSIQYLPMLLFSLAAGPLIDRIPKRRLIIATQSALLLLALALALLTLGGHAQYWQVLVLAFLLGAVNTIDAPARQSYVIEIAGRDALMNAISLNSAAFNLARIAGPALAGLLIGAIGIAPCFFINAASFAAVIAALFSIDAPIPPTRGRAGSLADIGVSVREGLSYIAGRKGLAGALALLGVISAVVLNYNTVVPTFAKGVLGGGARDYGFLMTAMGVGSFTAALSLAVNSKKGPSARRRMIGAAGMSITFALCGLQKNPYLSCALLALCGFFTVSFTASTNAYLQLSSDDEHRGRVMSIHSLIFNGVTPFGALYAGALIDKSGAGACMLTSGAIGLVSVAVALAVQRRGARAAKGG